MASDEITTRVVDAYTGIRALVAMWRKEFKPDTAMSEEAGRLQKIVEGSLDGLVTAMGLEVPEDGT